MHRVVVELASSLVAPYNTTRVGETAAAAVAYADGGMTPISLKMKMSCPEICKMWHLQNLFAYLWIYLIKIPVVLDLGFSA